MPLPWRLPPLPGRQPHRHMAAAEAEPPLLPPPEPPSRRSLRTRATLPRLVPGPTHLPWPPRPGTPTPRHTALGRSEERRVGSDWSSDVCSSDLITPQPSNASDASEIGSGTHALTMAAAAGNANSAAYGAWGNNASTTSAAGAAITPQPSNAINASEIGSGTHALTMAAAAGNANSAAYGAWGNNAFTTSAAGAAAARQPSSASDNSPARSKAQALPISTAAGNAIASAYEIGRAHV